MFVPPDLPAGPTEHGVTRVVYAQHRRAFGITAQPREERPMTLLGCIVPVSLALLAIGLYVVLA